MEDKFVRFSKLYILIFLSFLAIPVSLGLIAAILYGLSKTISSGPIDFVFHLLVISLPATVFATAYSIFFKRTAQHPVAAIRIISKILFAIGIISCLVLLTLDIILFFHQPATDIIDYRCFSIAFLAANVGGLFLIAILQAFTTKKETDWLERAGGPQ